MSESIESAPPVALLLIDMQPIFLDAMPDGDAVARRARFVAGAARLLGLPIVLTEQVPGKLGGTLPAVIEAAGEAPVFGKTAFSALRADGLRDWLRARGIEHLLLAGVETPICVYQTAVEAMADELDVTLLSDVISERRREDRAPAVESLRAAGAHILPSETVFYSLLGDATHPRFRDYTQLVKSA